MRILDSPTHPSNFGNGAGGMGRNLGRRFVILHGSGKYPTATAADELKYLQRPGIRVSYHLYVTKAGEVHRLVGDAGRAWHAGSSRWTDDGTHCRDLNDWSIGVAFESCNAFDETYPDAQIAAGLELVRHLMARHPNVTAERVLTHREVSDPPGRKVDPVAFPIDHFRQQLRGPDVRSLPLYSEQNVRLGDVTIVDDRKAYVSDRVREAL